VVFLEPCVELEDVVPVGDGTEPVLLDRAGLDHVRSFLVVPKFFFRQLRLVAIVVTGVARFVVMRAKVRFRSTRVSLTQVEEHREFRVFGE